MNSVFENAKNRYFERLSENEKQAKKLLRTWKNSIKGSNEKRETYKKIAELDATILEYKQAFVEDCKKEFRKVFFFDDDFKKDDSSYAVIAKYPNLDLSSLNFFNYDIDGMSYEDCVNFISNKKLISALTKDDDSGLAKYSLYKLGLYAAENEEILSKKEKKCERKEKLEKLPHLPVVQRIIKNQIRELKLSISECDEIRKALDILAQKIGHSVVACKKLPELLDKQKNKNYWGVKFYEDIKSKYEEHLQNIDLSLLYSTGIADEVERLRSKEEKIKVLSECFNKDVRLQLANDPAFLINLGRIDAAGSAKKLDKMIVDYLIKSFVDDAGVQEQLEK